MDSGINSYNHTVTMIERKSFVTSGVKKIENFDETQFLLDTVMGFLLVKGVVYFLLPVYRYPLTFFP